MGTDAVKFPNLVTKFPVWEPSVLLPSIWFDASDEATITEVGGFVSQWDDKSLNSYHVTQPTGSLQPLTGTRQLNGRNVIEFQGYASGLSQRGLQRTDANMGSIIEGRTHPWSHIGVFASDWGVTEQPNYGGIFYLGRSGFSQSFIAQRYTNFSGDHLDVYMYDGPGFSYRSESAPGLVTDPIIQFGSYDGVSPAFEHYRNGIDVNNQLGGSLPIPEGNDIALVNTLYVGRVQGSPTNLDGYIGELLIFDYQLSTAGRQELEGYLAHKWGLTANLPGGHPYKTSPP